MDKQKIIFFDVDDTLVHHRGDRSYIPESAKKALIKLKEAGHMVAIASGRGHDQILEIMKMLKIDHAVCFNGHMAVIDNQVAMEMTLDEDDTERLIHHLKKGIMPFIVMDEKNAYLKDFIGQVKKIIQKEVREVEGAEGDLYMGRLKKMKDAKGPFYAMMFFKKKFTQQSKYPHLSFKAWGGRGFEVSNKGVSKLSGIHWMADHFGIQHENIVVFGDNYNDIEMLEGIKHSVAMGNAVEAAKEAATYVTDHVGNHGIEKACYLLGLIEED